MDDEHRAVLAALDAAVAAGDAEYDRELRWELAALRLQLPDDERPVAALYEPEAYALDAAAAAHLRQRLAESPHPAARVRYAELLLSFGPDRGREWIDRTREAARQHRAFVDHAVAHVAPSTDGADGLALTASVRRATRLAARPGVLGRGDDAQWTAWIVGVAEALAAFPWSAADDARGRAFDQHRLPFEALEALAWLPARAAGLAEREAALRLVGAAYRFFEAMPAADLLATGVARVESALRQHFGEKQTYATYVRRRFEALIRRADMPDLPGGKAAEGMFVRQALELAMTHREVFSEQEIVSLRAREQAAFRDYVTSGEIETFSVQQPVDPEDYDMTAGTPEFTIEQLIEAAPGLLPDPDELLRDAAAADAGVLSSLVTQVSMRDTKVVSVPGSAEERHRLAADERLVLHAQNEVRLYIDVTLRRAHEREGLRPSHLMSAYRALALDDGTALLLERGYERYFADDYISACHVLVPRVEDVLRRELGRMGVETTQFQSGDESTSSRTDDATFGALLYRSTADAWTVKDLIGPPLFNYVQALFTSPTSLNLRNEFAHGLARPEHCNPATVAIVTHVLLCLVSLARGRADAGRATGAAGEAPLDKASAEETPPRGG